MTNYTLSLFFSLYLLSFSAFGGSGVPLKEESPEEKKITVVTTFTILADMAKNIVKEKAHVYSITRPGAEIHGYEPTPRDVAKAQKANLIFWNGLGLERWFQKFFSHVGDIPSVVVSQGVKPLAISEGAYRGKANPHAWMSLKNAQIYVKNMAKALVQYDPKNRVFYEENTLAYLQKIKSLRSQFQKSFHKIPREKKVLVTSEGAFSYLAQDFSMGELYLWPINAERQGTPKQIKKVIDEMREKKIPVIFSESTVSDKPAKQVAREAGARYGGVLYVDSLSLPSGRVPTYLDLMKVSVQTIVKGFLP